MSLQIPLRSPKWSRQMNMKQNPVVVAMCLCLASCCGETSCEQCPDVLSLKEKYTELRNDLTLHTYYCGCDDRWHYFAIERRMAVFDDVTVITLPQDVAIPFAMRRYGTNRDRWQNIDCHGDWISSFGDSASGPPRNCR